MRGVAIGGRPKFEGTRISQPCYAQHEIRWFARMALAGLNNPAIAVRCGILPTRKNSPSPIRMDPSPHDGRHAWSFDAESLLLESQSF